jgi:hypothetical protein
MDGKHCAEECCDIKPLERHKDYKNSPEDIRGGVGRKRLVTDFYKLGEIGSL